MHPRRMSGSPANIARYYAIGDYYTKGDAESSAWGGSLAQDLGLAGEVDSKIMKVLLAGKVAGQQLGRHRQEGIQHHPGWDFAISAPKSVSIMALAAGDERIVGIHERAVDAALNYLEEHAQFRRREGKEIVHETTGRLLWARFTEHASRELDPHLHTHVVIFNMTNREGGEPFASLESRAMYAEQMATGQIYRNQLAHGLRELGFEIEIDPRRGLFELSGVPRSLIAEMSRRAQQIEDHARAHGLVGQAERRKSFYATRGPKVKVGLNELHVQWAQRLLPHEKSISALQERVEEQGERRVEIEPSDAARAALILMGDNRQTGAIEQGKAFWLIQRLGLATAELTETRRQETEAMRAAVTAARAGDYETSVGALDKVVSGVAGEDLAKGLVAEWTRLKPKSRASTNILVLDNATRLIVNSQIREALKREGVVAAEDSRLSILSPAGRSDQEKRMARFYSSGQVVKFSRDQVALGLVRDDEYRVIGIGRDEKGRQHVRLVDNQGRVLRWDPRTSKAAQVNIFLVEERRLSAGDRIQWRLVAKGLQLKNAERGTVEKLEGSLATIRWDRDGRVQQIDLSRHKTWDHGYGETVYSAQSKTYDRAYVLAPIGSPLVNGQNYYTAITRARFGVKLWTEDKQKLIDKLTVRSGEKTSSLEGLGRLDQDHSKALSARQEKRIARLRDEQIQQRQARQDRQLERELGRRGHGNGGLARRFAENARLGAVRLERHLRSFLPGRDQQSYRGDEQRRDEQASEERNGIDR